MADGGTCTRGAAHVPRQHETYSPGDRVLLCDRTEGRVEGEVLQQAEERVLVYYVLPRLRMRVVGWLRVEELEGRAEHAF